MSEEYRNFNHSRKKAIMNHCFECSGMNASERRKCTAVGCALWAFRNGYEVDENDQKIINPNYAKPTGQFGARISCDDTELDCEFEPEIDSDEEDEQL